ncbi:uncharacterized protein LOC123675523 [Harmonia axyridis]|uniref:uncharacterized protein LOC123675523 n=1 Tax=Harmonia axyridis TaxID=115357 RepID=UPI001E276E43|nr:uncharacterized protein LOC123675523 [Harmonia axyridis]
MYINFCYIIFNNELVLKLIGLDSVSIMFLLIPTLFILFPLSSEYNPEERDWLDHCDLIKLKERCAAVKTTAPIPETTTKKGGFFWWWKSQKNVGFRPMAHEKEILESLKQKLISDSKFRGESEEDDPWTFDSEYDYYYGGGDIPYYWSETVPPL